MAVEAFDGKHRGRLQGGGQYYAHQGVEANELVRPFMPGSDKPSALTKVGKALRVEALAAHVIKLLLNVSPTTPRIPGIFVPPLAPAAAAVAPAVAVVAAAPAAAAVAATAAVEAVALAPAAVP